MGQKIGACLLAAGMLLLSGCQAAFDFLPYAREIEDMALMRTMGVDLGQQNASGVLVTVSSGVQSKGAEKGDQPPIILSQESGTISGANLSMQAEGASYIFYGHVQQLLLGQALAERGVSPALDYVLRDIEMRLDTELYIIRGSTAQEAISSTSDRSASTADRLRAMEDDAGLLSHSMPRTVRQVLEDLCETGCSFAPAVAITPAGEDKNTLSAAGYALFKDAALAGWATGDAASGLNLMTGQVDADIIELEQPGSGPVALRVVDADTQVKPVFTGDTLIGLDITCQVDANLAESAGKVDLYDKDAMAFIELSLAQVEQHRITEVLALSQSLDADFLRLENWAGIAAPWYWDKIQTQWNLPSLAINVTVKAQVCRGYDIDR